MTATHPSPHNPRSFPDLFAPLRYGINHTKIRSYKTAHLICKLIPCSCPFERDISLLGRTFHIPPLCKLNPLYNELIMLRLRALSYLTDICEEDVTSYLC
ncbi:Mo-dependent nitrogenase C-terminal domain-containing protein [Cyanobacteria bacterium FACHB-63]|nr:Mo-dependent nitrogenase C-terminal domain-containing protein [Cyanobacteria bacterium FACHB-63]